MAFLLKRELILSLNMRLGFMGNRFLLKISFTAFPNGKTQATRQALTKRRATIYMLYPKTRNSIHALPNNA